MSGIPYHAWTHRPKSRGGTDPISDDLPWARRSKGADASAQTVVTSSIQVVTFNHEYNMDPGPPADGGHKFFEAVSGNAIKVLVEGYFAVTAEVIWETGDFDFGIGIQDGIAPGGHWSGQTGHTNFTQFSYALPTMLHRYERNQQVQLAVVQFAGVSRNVDMAYLEVTYMGSYRGLDFDEMDPYQ